MLWLRRWRKCGARSDTGRRAGLRLSDSGRVEFKAANAFCRTVVGEAAVFLIERQWEDGCTIEHVTLR